MVKINQRLLRFKNKLVILNKHINFYSDDVLFL